MNRARAVLVVVLAVAAMAAMGFVACGDDDEATSSITPIPTAAGQTGQATVAPNACGDKTTTDTGEVTVKSYDAEPPMTIDPAKTYIATVKTERGDFKIKLRADLAPHHVNSFIFLAKDGFFDHNTFHRVLPGFVAQTGDPTGTGGGSPGYSIAREVANTIPYARGVVGMARATAPDSAGSQWFVTYGGASSLNGEYTVFGEVTEGMEVVDCITPRDPSRNPNLPPGDKIISITIDES